MSFGSGFFLVLVGWPIMGMILEAYGFVVLFRSEQSFLLVFWTSCLNYTSLITDIVYCTAAFGLLWLCFCREYLSLVGCSNNHSSRRWGTVLTSCKIYFPCSFYNAANVWFIFFCSSLIVTEPEEYLSRDFNVRGTIESDSFPWLNNLFVFPLCNSASLLEWPNLCNSTLFFLAFFCILPFCALDACFSHVEKSHSSWSWFLFYGFLLFFFFFFFVYEKKIS